MIFEISAPGGSKSKIISVEATVLRPAPPVLCAEMVCYVDTVRSYPTAGLRFREFCHLLADSREELHAMAQELGMPRRMFQDHPWRWHYDLPRHLRIEAVRLGAHELTMHEVGALLRSRRVRLVTDG